VARTARRGRVLDVLAERDNALVQPSHQGFCGGRGIGDYKTLITNSGQQQELEFFALNRAGAEEELFWHAQATYDQVLSHHGYEGNSFIYRVNECESDDEFAEYILFCGDDDDFEAARADGTISERAWA